MSYTAVRTYPRNNRVQYDHSPAASYSATSPPLPSFSSKSRPEHKLSKLLSPEENGLVFQILERGRQALATAVARLLTSTPGQRKWEQQDLSRGVLVVCLVKDFERRSYFIEAFYLLSRRMVFSQEIYNEFQYDMLWESFMTFEGDSSMVAIMFADENEAFDFREALDKKLERDKRRQKNEFSPNPDMTAKPRILMESNVISAPPSEPNHTLNLHQNAQSRRPGPSKGHASTSNSSLFPSKPRRSSRTGKEKRRAKLTASDIGAPMDFRHVQHVGFDPSKGFSVHLEDEDLRTFFEKAGISDNQLKDEDTRKFILNFMETNDVVGIVKRSNSNNSGSTTIPPPPPLPHPTSGPVPPIPPPPPPPSSGPVRPPPPPPIQVTPADVVDTGHAKQVQPVAADNRSQLLQQIQHGEFKLKKVDVNTPPKGNRRNGSTPPGDPKSTSTGNNNTMDDMAGALSRALAERQRAVNPDSSSSEDDSDDDGIGDDEWED